MITDQRSARDRLAFALDVDDLDAARRWIAQLRSHVGVFKVGLELFVREGPASIRAVHDAGAACFLDLKLHDIPETVARAVQSATRENVAYLTVHAAGGVAMLRRALDVCAGRSTRVLAVTALTSLSDADVEALGFGSGANAMAVRLADLAYAEGTRGFVCSAHEVAALRARMPDATLVTPGIRPAASARGDQKRVATPGEAIRWGADLLVVGRPIRDAEHPADVARAIVDEIEASAA